MLVLSRQRDESIIIGDNIVVTIVDIRGDKVRLGINAPTEIPVHRQEVYEAIRARTCAGATGSQGCGSRWQRLGAIESAQAKRRNPKPKADACLGRGMIGPFACAASPSLRFCAVPKRPAYMSRDFRFIYEPNLSSRLTVVSIVTSAATNVRGNSATRRLTRRRTTT